jgi:hypothetical protein
MPGITEGFDAVAAALRDLRDPKQTGKALLKGVRQGMQEPFKRAKELIPEGTEAHYVGRWKGPPGTLVHPGFARESIRVIAKADRDGQRAYALLGVRSFAYYAVQFVELGTSKMPAHPWLRPAFLGSRDPAIRMLGDGINEWISEVAAKHRSGAKGYAGGAARADALDATAGASE